MKQLILIAHNLRSTHNVGSLLRTADGLGLSEVWLTGYTPYPLQAKDNRLPHLAIKVDKHIAKTALGAERNSNIKQSDDITTVINKLKGKGFCIAGLEQNKDATSLISYRPPDKIALIVGREVEGIEAEILEQCDLMLEIPMFGKKESYNVSVAAAMALYSLKFADG
jgi:23S rRNA (guanosine2251-2'-O)-methyltransferase